MSSRIEIINTIGIEYHTSNIENGEFSYPKALKDQGKEIAKNLVSNKQGKINKFLDLRFANDKISILIETKDNYDKYNLEDVYRQITSYINYERKLTSNKIVVILANTLDTRLKVWVENSGKLEINDRYLIKSESSIRAFDEYEDICNSRKNDKLKIIQNTYELNELLHKHGIKEKLRSQFVGTCLLSLKNGLKFEALPTKQIISGIEDILTKLLDKDLRKAEKLVILKNKILDSQDIKDLKNDDIQEILRNINNNILPYINDKNTLGQDLLNLFFTTFNKYVGKADKNQAFTPEHIVHFMCKVVEVNRNSRVLDPCCGSGSFLVRALTEAMDDCPTKKDKEDIKKNNIFGIEYEEGAFGLATTNMLIHGDGNSNIIKGNCFDLLDFIENAKINIVLMNPPYNAQKRHSNEAYVKTWPNNAIYDPSKGFHFAYYIASIVKTGKMALLLPMQCAIGASKEIEKFKELMLREHTLDAVFSLPADMFHPGANANACCMVFNLGVRHDKANKPTFFGYFKDDGFVKRKNLGRVQKLTSGKGSWEEIEKLWLDLYKTRKDSKGLSVNRIVSPKDEWLAEAYIETDYTQLTYEHFKKTIREILAYKIIVNEKVKIKENISTKKLPLNISNWKYFKVSNLFTIKPTLGTTTDELIEGNEIAYISAKSENNGLEYMVAQEGNEDFISEGNCIVFIQLGAGSAGFTTYQPKKFIGMSGKTSCGYSKHLNTFIGAFLVTILNLERPRYSYGRSWTGDRLNDTKIKLPVDSKDQPDWKFMENFIKSLPYGCSL